MALYGYIGDNETPATWGADAMVRVQDARLYPGRQHEEQRYPNQDDRTSMFCAPEHYSTQ